MTLIPRDVANRIANGIGGLLRTSAAASTSIVPEARREPWFGPGQAQRPIAPPEDVAGRSFDYQTGINLNTRPRAYEGVSFEQLRGLAESFDLVRLAIETCKDQMAALTWGVKPRMAASDDVRGPPDARCAEVEAFFRYPDRKHSWDAWNRMLDEEQLVLDAASIYIRRDQGGRPYAFEIVDGATIVPKLDISGRTPDAPMSAYQQVLKGMPAIDYSVDDLIYAPRNPRAHKLYGYGAVEQVIFTINIAVRREVAKMNYFIEGNIPDALCAVPKEWTPDQIERFQKFWDVMMSSAFAKNGRMKFVPGASAVQMLRSDEVLFGQFDEWLARIICYAFSLPSLPFIKQQNRACYSEDTETLTEKGWRRLEEIEGDEKIGTYNPDTGAVEFHAPIGRYVYPYSGPMVRFKTRAVDVLVTPEHKVWLRGDHAGAYEKVAAEGVPNSQFHFVASATFDGEERAQFTLPPNLKKHSRQRTEFTVPMDDWLELLGFFLSEDGLSSSPGYEHVITIAQKPGDTANRIQDVLERLPFRFSRYPQVKDGVQRWNVYGRQICDWLRAEAGAYCQEKRIPRQFMDLSARQLGILFSAMMSGDENWDTRENRTSGAYFTTSRQLCDDVQELAFRLGYSASASSHYEAHGNRQAAYRVLLCDRKEHSLRKVGTARTPASVSVEQYEGNVYCFEVPNHLFITRRNGKIGIHGNTAETANDAALSEGLAPRMAWRKSIYDRLIQTAFGYADIEFCWDDVQQVDPEEQAARDIESIKMGLKSVDEVRASMGLAKIGIGHAIWGVGPMGFMFVGDILKAQAQGLMMPPPPVAPGYGAPGVPGQTPPGPRPGPPAMLEPPTIDGTAEPVPNLAPDAADAFAGLPPDLLAAVGLGPGGPSSRAVDVTSGEALDSHPARPSAANRQVLATLLHAERSQGAMR